MKKINQLADFQRPKVQKEISVSKKEENILLFPAWCALAIISITIFIIYFKSMSFGFIWDDDLYISLNSDVKHLSWSNIKLIFSGFYVGNYQPLTMMLYAIEYKIAGNSATLFHIVNIVIHLFNTYLVFDFVRKISSNIGTSVLTAVFFAVHPMHVESVVWISGRKDLVYTFFFLLSLIVYIRYLKDRELKFLIYSGFFFILSCMSKSAAVILPLILLLIDYYLNRKYDWKLLIEKIPFFAVSILFGIIALYSQKEAGAIAENHSFSFIDKLCIISYCFDTYLIKGFLPIDLSAQYPYPDEKGILPLFYYLAPVLVVILLYWVWHSRKWGKDILFGFLFFVITILLVLQFIPIGSVMMSERYTYVPYIGLFFIVGKSFHISYFSNVRSKAEWLSFVFLFAIIVFSIISFNRVKYWKNEETLFADAIKKGHITPAAYHNMAYHQLYKSAVIKYADNPVLQENYYLKAELNFTKAIEMISDISYFHRGYVRALLKNYKGAVEDYDKVIEIFPANEEAHYNKAISEIEIGEYKKAIEACNTVIKLNPLRVEAYYNRGIAKAGIKEYQEAIKDYDKAIELNPLYSPAYNNRGFSKGSMNDHKGAYIDFSKAVELSPQDSNAVRNRDMARTFLRNSKQ